MAWSRFEPSTRNVRLRSLPAAAQKRGMKISALHSALLAVFVAVTPASGQNEMKSSPDDRRRFVSIVENLERAPLDPALGTDRRWAIEWLTDAPDVTVTVCADLLGGLLSEKNFAHSPEIVVQYPLAMAAFIIENSDKAKDPDAQQLAGIASALKAYRAMRNTQPDNKSPALEKLIDAQDRGELPGVVQKAYLRCSAKGAKRSG